MKQIVVFNMVSADGYFKDANNSIDWHVVDKEFDKAAVEIIQRFDTILFGRTTYQLFEGFWPKVEQMPEVSEEDKTVGRKINEMNKVVVSNTLQEVTWENSEIMRELTAENIKALKAREGKDIVIYGSGTIVQQLTEMDLIDEYQLMVNPVILGAGKSMFEGVKSLSLELLASRQFQSGNVLLTYRRKA